MTAHLDSGSFGSLIESKFAKKLRKKRGVPVTWNTAAGAFTTNHVAKINMQLPEILDALTITSDLHLADRILPRYDMVLGRDVLAELGIILDFENGQLNKGDIQIPMMDIDNLPLKCNKKYMQKLKRHKSHFATNIPEPPLAAKAVKRASQILEAKYAAQEPDAIA